jgi:hypothetical protein
MINPRQILQFYDLKKLGLFLKIMIDIPIVRFLLIWMKMPNLLGWLDQSSRIRKPFEKRDLDRGKLGWKYVNFFLVCCLRRKNPCLLRSLILFHLFRREGLDAKIHFGIKYGVTPLEGHSWISFNGASLFEQTDPQLIYIDVYSYPYETGIFESSHPND